MTEEKKLTGYPSVDKPWLKYYTKDFLETPIHDGTIYDRLYEESQAYLKNIAISYFSTKITYKILLEKIDEVAAAFSEFGVKKGDIVNVALPNTPENVYIVYGLNKIGAVANLIDLRSKGDALIYYFAETRASVAVVCDLFANNINEIMERTNLETVIIVSPYDSIAFPFRALLKAKVKYNNSKFIKWRVFVSAGKKQPFGAGLKKPILAK